MVVLPAPDGPTSATSSPGRHRLARLDRAALQRNDDGVDLGQLQIVGGHADGLHRAQALARQRVGEIGGAGVVVGDAAKRNSTGQPHYFAPA